MEINTLVKYRYSHNLTFIGIIVESHRDNRPNQKLIRDLAFPNYYCWRQETELSPVDPNTLTPYQHSKLPLPVILKLIGDNLNVVQT